MGTEAAGAGAVRILTAWGLCSFGPPSFFGSQITEHQGMVSDRSTLSWTDLNTFVDGQLFCTQLF